MEKGEERVYTIPLRKAWLKQTRIQRVPRSVNVLREFIQQHTKAESVKVSPLVNEFLWLSGIKTPPAKIKVKVSVEDGVAFARMPDEKVEQKEKSKPKAESGGLMDKVKQSLGESKSPTQTVKTVAAEKTDAPKTPPEENKEAKKENPQKLTPEEEAQQLLKEAEAKIKEEDQKKST